MEYSTYILHNLNIIYIVSIPLREIGGHISGLLVKLLSVIIEARWVRYRSLMFRTEASSDLYS